MAEDQGKKEDQFAFTPEGEALGYISLEQARVVAMRTARDHPGNYGRRFAHVRMVFSPAEQEEGEDYYVVTLSFRPEGDFTGTPGQEQFFIEKEGNVAVRQVLSLPSGAGGRRFPLVGVAVGLVVVGIAAVGAVVALGGGFGGTSDARPTATPAPTPTQPLPTPAGPTSTPVQVVVTPVLGHLLSIGGAAIGPGQVSMNLANGLVTISEPPGRDGRYPRDVEITLRAEPAVAGSEVTWEGVDSQRGGVATVRMSLDRSVAVNIFSPVPATPPKRLDDHGDSPEAASFVSAGSYGGVIDPPSDLDYFAFFALAGESYVIEAELDGHEDTYLTLYDGRGFVLDENDDADGLGTGSRITWTAPYDGDFYLEVRSLDQASDKGAYVLNLIPSVDDHGDSPQAATYIFPGSYDGVIDPPPDLDYFAFFALAGESYVIEVELDGHEDTYLTLYDGRGSFLDENDDADGLGNGSRITWTAPYDGDFYLEVRSLDQASDRGAYVLSLILLEDDHGDTPEAATFISPGSYDGVIDPPPDLDYFSFFALGGESYVIEAQLDGHPDTYLALYDGGGSVLEENDDADGLGRGSRISWTAPYAGDFFLEVSSLDQASDTGPYLLHLVLLEDDHGDTPEAATFISSGSYSGVIDPAPDLDYFAFSARAGESYVIEVALDGHEDTYLTLYDGGGSLLEENDDGDGLGRGSRISWRAPYTGDFFLEVRSYDRDIEVGGYIVSLARLTRPTPAPPTAAPPTRIVASYLGIESFQASGQAWAEIASATDCPQSTCLRAGTIPDLGWSSLQLSLYHPTDPRFRSHPIGGASVSFYVRVSSESCCDMLTFKIGGAVAGQWSGEQPWRLVEFPIPSVRPLFLEWEYRKDSSASSGRDAAWLDRISLN